MLLLQPGVTVVWLASITPSEIYQTAQKFRRENPQIAAEMEILFGVSDDYLYHNLQYLTSPCSNPKIARRFAITLAYLLHAAHGQFSGSPHPLIFSRITYARVDSEMLDCLSRLEFVEKNLTVLHYNNPYLHQYVMDQSNVAGDDEQQFQLIAAFFIRLFELQRIEQRFENRRDGESV